MKDYVMGGKMIKNKAAKAMKKKKKRVTYGAISNAEMKAMKKAGKARRSVKSMAKGAMKK